MGRGRPPVSFRTATPDDATALSDLEEAANLVALGDVFPAAEHPFPRRAVLDRWVAVLDDPVVKVEVVDRDDGEIGLACFVAYDPGLLRHLAVHPDRWGSGLARAAVDRAVAAIVAAGNRPRLWCLVDNHRALGLYAHLGWVPSGRCGEAEWPPHPTECELVLEDCGP
jgi:GNAT superfamily N-acetyltransferase